MESSVPSSTISISNPVNFLVSPIQSVPFYFCLFLFLLQFLFYTLFNIKKNNICEVGGPILYNYERRRYLSQTGTLKETGFFKMFDEIRNSLQKKRKPMVLPLISFTSDKSSTPRSHFGSTSSGCQFDTTFPLDLLFLWKQKYSVTLLPC